MLRSVKNLKSKKWLVVVLASLLALTDLMAIIAVASGGYASKHLAGPIILLILDVVYVVNAVFSNFRMKYTVRDTTIYAVLLVVGSVGVMIGETVGSGSYIMTTAMGFIWLITHIVAIGAIVVAMLFAARYKGKKITVLSAVATVAFLALSITYMTSSMVTGFFGQDEGDGRALAYTYNPSGGYYTVVDVLEGRGDYAVIPETFNGKPVTVVDSRIFLTKGVKNYFIEDAKDMRFDNLSSLNYALNANLDVKLFTAKEDVDYLKTYFHKAAQTSFGAENALHAFANSFAPILDEGEVYVTFNYDASTYSLVGGNLIPTWYGEQGDVFSFRSYYEKDSTFSYLAHLDKKKESDLYWNFIYNDGRIMDMPVFDGVMFNGMEIYQSFEHNVTFDKIYTVSIETDNDRLYEMPESVKRYGYVDDSNVISDCRYVVASTADEFLRSLPERKGFDLSWSYYTTSSYYENAMTSLASVIANQSYVTNFSIVPNWSLKAPTLRLESNVGEDVTYGDEVVLEAVTSTPVDGVEYEYTWYKNGLYITSATSSSLDMGTPLPNESGLYAVSVKAYSSTVTSLTAEVENDKWIEIGKKELDFNWILPTDLVYSGTNKTLGCTLVSGQTVGSDYVTFDYTNKTVRDAGTKTSTIELTSLTDRYVVKPSKKIISYVVEPYGLNVSWSAESYEYNGLRQTPTATATGVGLDGELSVLIESGTDGCVSAGNHSVTAYVNDNYKVLNATRNYSIAQKPVSVIFGETVEFVYNGTDQRVDYQVVGTVGSETAYPSAIGIGRNVGSYTLSVSIGNSNYLLTGATEKAYAILPKPLTVDWDDNVDFTYNGAVQKVDYTLNGLVGYESAGVVEKGSAINAGEYTFELSLPTRTNYTFEGAVTEVGYIIHKKDISVSWQGTDEFEYSGAVQKVGYSVVGLVAGDNVTINESGMGAEVNTYDFTLTLAEHPNYELTGTTHKQYAIKKKTLNVHFSSDTELNYDGEVRRISYIVTGTVNGETVSFTEGGTATNVGKYTYTLTLQEHPHYTVSSNPSVSYEIKKAPLSVIWSNVKSFVYDGNAHKATVSSVNGAITGEESLVEGLISTSGEKINAGTNYQTVASVPESSNYYIKAGATTYFNITKRTLTVAFDENRTFTYNGVVQSVGYEVENAVPGDSVVTTLTGTSKNAGTHVESVSLTSASVNANYRFNSTPTCSYEIKKYDVAVSWGSIRSFTYDGNSHKVALNSSVLNGVVGETFEAYTTGEQTNAGTGYFTTALSRDGNYNLTNSTCAFEITQRELTVTFNANRTFTYDGNAHSVAFTVNGRVGQDAVGTKVSYVRGNCIDAGEHEIEVELTNKHGNYKLVGVTTVTFTIQPREVTLSFTTVIGGYVNVDQIRAYKAKVNESGVSVTVKYKYVDANGNPITIENMQSMNTYKVIAYIEEENYVASEVRGEFILLNL